MDILKGRAPLGTYRTKAILGVVVALTVTSTVSLALRFVGKRIKKTKVLVEDWVIIAAQVAIYALAGVSILEVVLGNVGHHAIESPTKVSQSLKLLIAVQCLYATSLGLIKISICLFYNRIFPFRSFHVASWAVIAIIFAWAASAVIYAFVSCRPFSFFWDHTIPGGKCVSNQTAPYVAFGAVDVLVDIIMLALPVPLIWKLQISLADKIALFCIFGAGISTMIISILRVKALASWSFSNITYTGAYVLLWSFAEPAIGITVACAPLFRPIFRRAREKKNTEMMPLPRFHRLEDNAASFPSFVNLRAAFVRHTAHHGSQVTTQILESGNWSHEPEETISISS